MGYATLPLYTTEQWTSDKAAAAAVPVVIYAVQISANGGNVDVELCNAATDGSEDDLVYHILDGDSRLFDYTGLGGIAFGVALTVDMTSNATVRIWGSAPLAA